MFNFARIASQQVIPVLLDLLTKVDEDDAEDEYNVARASYQCLQLYANCIGGEVVPHILQFVEQHLRHDDWHKRDAAVAAFGAIMDGPQLELLVPLVKQAVNVILERMNDPVLTVKDSAAYAISRICEFCPNAIDPNSHLQALMTALFNGLASHPKMAASCCLALMNLADHFLPDTEEVPVDNPLRQHFQDSITSLLQVTEKAGSNNQLRTAAYEVLVSFATNAPDENLSTVANLSTVILERFEQTIPMQSQVVSIEDRLMLEELQISVASVMLSIVQRLEQHIAPQTDRIMEACLQALKTLPGKSGVPDTIFAVISSVAGAIEDDFLKYMPAFTEFLYRALGNQEEPGLCAIAIGTVSDVARALGEKVQPFCDTFMNYLLNNLRSNTLSNQLKPAILECFGDIAREIGVQFDSYFGVVAQVLQQAAGVTASSDVSLDMMDYITSLREGIIDAWGGILLAFKGTEKSGCTSQISSRLC